jgi:hypothetical protein
MRLPERLGSSAIEERISITRSTTGVLMLLIFERGTDGKGFSFLIAGLSP